MTCEFISKEKATPTARAEQRAEQIVEAITKAACRMRGKLAEQRIRTLPEYYGKLVYDPKGFLPDLSPSNIPPFLWMTDALKDLGWPEGVPLYHVTTFVAAANLVVERIPLMPQGLHFSYPSNPDNRKPFLPDVVTAKHTTHQILTAFGLDHEGAGSDHGLHFVFLSPTIDRHDLEHHNTLGKTGIKTQEELLQALFNLLFENKGNKPWQSFFGNPNGLPDLELATGIRSIAQAIDNKEAPKPENVENFLEKLAQLTGLRGNWYNALRENIEGGITLITQGQIDNTEFENLLAYMLEVPFHLAANMLKPADDILGRLEPAVIEVDPARLLGQTSPAGVSLIPITERPLSQFQAVPLISPSVVKGIYVLDPSCFLSWLEDNFRSNVLKPQIRGISDLPKKVIINSCQDRYREPPINWGSVLRREDAAPVMDISDPSLIPPIIAKAIMGESGDQRDHPPYPHIPGVFPTNKPRI